MRKLFSLVLAAPLALTLLAAAPAHAQRTAAVGEQKPTTTSTGVSVPKPPPAPASVPAKYEGGVVGYAKADGTINFDDANRRLLFRDKKGKEMFSVGYDVVNAAWADSKSQRSTAGTVVSHTVPFGGLAGMFMKSKTRYLILQYRDPDTGATGAASFKLGSKELLASVLHTFGEKAGLTQRGDAYVRRNATTSNVSNP